MSHPSRFDARIEQVVNALSPWVQDKAAREEIRAAAREEVQAAFVSLLTDLRRAVAGDGPAHRPAGVLEHFDSACIRLGVPFIEP